MNQVCLIGNVTKDIELKYTQSGKAVCQIGIAVNEGYGEKKKTHFFIVTVWEKQAEACGQYLAKGSKIAVNGRLQQRTWEAQDGTKRSMVEILANHVEFLDTKKKETSQVEAQPELSLEDNPPF